MIQHLSGTKKIEPKCPYCHKSLMQLAIWNTGIIIILLCPNCQHALGTHLLPDAIPQITAAVPAGQSEIKEN